MFKQENETLQDASDKYYINFEKSKEVPKLESLIKSNLEVINKLEFDIESKKAKLKEIETRYSEKLLQETKNKYDELISELSKNKTMLESQTQVFNELTKEVAKQNKLKLRKEEITKLIIALQETSEFLIYMRDLYSRLPQELSRRYREHVAHMSTSSYKKISKEAVHIFVTEDYELQLIDDKNEKNIKTIDQLSGGEQMSIALSVRFAMMRQLSGLDIYFLDEPTINLDYQRRSNIAAVVADISKDLSQMFVISHDDTFDDITERIIKVIKEDDISRVE